MSMSPSMSKTRSLSRIVLRCVMGIAIMMVPGCTGLVGDSRELHNETVTSRADTASESTDDTLHGSSVICPDIGEARRDLAPFVMYQELPENGKTTVLILACLVNQGQNTIKVYTPGFAGPEIWKRSEYHYEPIGFYHPPLQGADSPLNFVALTPGSAFCREMRIPGSLADVLASYEARCHYLLYEEGREGDARAVIGVLHSKANRRRGESK